MGRRKPVIGSGDLVQHIQYVPFGEVFLEERNASWSTPYNFNGKEQDEETGLCYYGARYYDPKTSVWLSVDPLAEITMESYSYCGNNPVNYIDKYGLYKNKTDAITYAKGKGGGENDVHFDKKSKEWFISMDKTGNNIYSTGGTLTRYFGNSNISDYRISFGPNANSSTVSNYSLGVIRDVMRNSGNNSLIISSTTRTPQDQARIMFGNIAKFGKNHQKDLYGPSGDKVIEQFPDREAMLKMILKVGSTHVSKHCANPANLNVIDIAPSSVHFKEKFIVAVLNDKRIRTFYYPKKDPAYHIEIIQNSK